MSGVSSPVLERLEPRGGHPAVTYRQAGDRAVLVEYGEMELDLTLNFFVLAVDAAASTETPDGLIETAPGFRSMLVRYDPLKLSTSDLLTHLSKVHGGIPAEQEIEIPSRVITLPIAFDESQSRAAVERYVRSIRKDAPNCEGANNIDYIVSYNGFSGREEFYEAVLATEHWTGFIGFFPGLPFMFPIDPRHTVVVPKYNPDGSLVIEGVKRAWDPHKVAARAVRVADEGRIDAVDGSDLVVAARSVCIHGDAPNAVEVARAVRQRLDESGVEVLALREIVTRQAPAGAQVP